MGIFIIRSRRNIILGFWWLSLFWWEKFCFWRGKTGLVGDGDWYARWVWFFWWRNSRFFL